MLFAGTFDYQDLYEIPPLRREQVEWQQALTPVLDVDELRELARVTGSSLDDRLEGLEVAAKQYIESYVGMPATKGRILDRFRHWSRHLPLTLLPSPDPLDQMDFVTYFDGDGEEQVVPSADYIVDTTGRSPAIQFTDTPNHDLDPRHEYPVLVTYISGASLYKRDVVVKQAARFLVEMYLRTGDETFQEERAMDRVNMLLQSARRSRVVPY